MLRKFVVAILALVALGACSVEEPAGGMPGAYTVGGDGGANMFHLTPPQQPAAPGFALL